MKIYINNKQKNIKFKGKIIDLIHKLKLRREEVLVKINGYLREDDYRIKDNDKVEIIQFIFGG